MKSSTLSIIVAVVVVWLFGMWSTGSSAVGLLEYVGNFSLAAIIMAGLAIWLLVNSNKPSKEFDGMFLKVLLVVGVIVGISMYMGQYEPSFGRFLGVEF